VNVSALVRAMTAGWRSIQIRNARKKRSVMG